MVSGHGEDTSHTKKFNFCFLPKLFLFNSWVKVIDLRAIQGNQKQKLKLNPLLHQHNYPTSHSIFATLHFEDTWNLFTCNVRTGRPVAATVTSRRKSVHRSINKCSSLRDSLTLNHPHHCLNHPSPFPSPWPSPSYIITWIRSVILPLTCNLKKTCSLNICKFEHLAQMLTWF